VEFIDLSTTGAGVLVPSPVDPGAAVTFVVNTLAGPVLLIRGRVRRVVARDGEWLAGCQFDRRLTEGDLAELL
jgi:hypothetical protein